MEIVVIGGDISVQECQRKFGDQHQYRVSETHSGAGELLKPETVVFDFGMGEPTNHRVYQNFSGIVFVDVSRNAGTEIFRESTATFFGFCGLPTFLNREILEVSLFKELDKNKLGETCRGLNTKFAVVKNQVGLITPRVICMIINESYFAIQENIASRNDIDLAMKLGTNYPFGPFDWCERIGIKNVYELLRAVYENTKDDRYKICELLEEEAGHFTPRR
jgi:3-hydroxybutyryl-CoA dehydrogenase